uniref:Uncharacterized protein n=2 Tax=Chrysotila carterae TaxID=13221 RepID=A0A7S4F0D9_CHRCT
MRGESSRISSEMSIHSLQDECGWLVFAENTSRLSTMSVMIDASQSFNLLASRRCMETVDAVPPRHAQLLQVFSFCSNQGSSLRMQTQCQSLLGGGEMHSPPLECAMHSAVPASY